MESSQDFKKILDLGFKKDNGSEYKVYSKKTCPWYIYHGDCKLEESVFLDKRLKGANILIKGNLTVDGLLTDKNIHGIIVEGDVLADNILIQYGPIRISGRVHFRDVMIVEKAEDIEDEGRKKSAITLTGKLSGTLLYVNRNRLDLSPRFTQRDDIKLFCRIDYQWYWGNFEASLKNNYVDYDRRVSIETDEIEKEEFGVDKMQIYLPDLAAIRSVVTSGVTGDIFEKPEIEKEKHIKIVDKVKERYRNEQAIEDSLCPIELLKKRLENYQDKHNNYVKKYEEYHLDTQGLTEKLCISSPRILDRKSIQCIFKEKELNAPEAYLDILTKVGAFGIGEDGDEFALLHPNNIDVTLGTLLDDHILCNSNISEDDRAEFSMPHYFDFVVIATYGTFPYELGDYSDGIAFNKKDLNEIIYYSCDGYWLSELSSERESLSSEGVIHYVIRCMEKLSERMEASCEENLNYIISTRP